ncbi:hypothetical protein F4802DRAFT_387072 [Xylaria palmicola]|nr:hypothetical protein F4802DRAFT_387072 [Xylaria palmicola]
MSMSMNIPGYYYDAEKKRYFKVEKSSTAPANAAWASTSVKRRKLRDADAAAALRHLHLARSRVRRARVLHEPLTGGFFAREHGAMADDMPAASFVEGLRNKGRVPLLRPGIDAQGQVRRMYVDGRDERTGMCTVYAVPNETTLLSTYIPRDKNKRLNARLLANYRLPAHFSLPPYAEAQITQISDIQYHAPTNSLLAASRLPSACPLFGCRPVIDDGDDGDPLCPRWQLPSVSRLTTPSMNLVNPLGDDFEAYCIAPAPASSPLICVAGTNRGLVRWDRASEPLSWLTPPAPPGPRRRGEPNPFRDVFAVGFHPGQDSVLRFGGRPGALFTADTRVDPAAWSHVRLPSAITHLRCLDGGNQVLVAGLRDHLGVYDLRFARSYRGAAGEDGVDLVGSARGSRHPRSEPRDRRRGKRTAGERWRKNGDGGDGGGSGGKAITRPVIRFEYYRNAAHVDAGLAYDAPTGVVAAAHDDVPGTVALYSVRTGARLRVLDFATEGRGGPGEDRARADLPVVQALQFQTFPGDHTPTLFAGGDRHGGITAFSFGVDDLEDEA